MIFPDLIARRAELTPDKVAITELHTGTSLTYRALETLSARMAGAMLAQGVGAGDRVAVICRNRADFFALLFACARIEAILVPLNWRSPAAELGPVMALAAPRLLLAGAEDRACAGQLAQEAGIALVEMDAAPHWAADAAPCPPRHGWREDQVWYLLFTSGTTGLPKAVIQTVGMGHVNAVNVGHAVQLTGADTTLNFLPLFHTAGINLHTMPALLAGAEVLLLPGFEAELVMPLLVEGRVSAFFAVPAVYQALSLHPDFASADLSRVRHWGCGGAPLPDTLVEAFAARGALVANGMGMTETGPTVFLADPATARSKIGSVGKPQLLSRVRIVRPDGSEAGIGEPGELWITGPGITPGYWNNPQATAAAITPDGWLRSGDLATRDSDGCYAIVGRLKEMFISGAENVYPAEVENVLASHPAVLEAAVRGVPDERWGEVGWAFLLARPEHVLPGAAELTAWCRERLAAYKVPRRFIAVDEFPRTAAGKIQKHLIPLPSPDTPSGTQAVLLPQQGQFDRFAALSGDHNPIHVSADFAARSGFGRTVAHGAMLTGWLLGALGPRAVEATVTAVRFPAPAYAGEALRLDQSAGQTPAQTAAQTAGQTALVRAGTGEPVCVLEDPPAEAPGGLPDSLAPALPLAPGMTVTRSLQIDAAAAGQLAEVMPVAVDGVLARRMLILGGWSALLGVDLPGLGTNYLKQQSWWLAPVPDGPVQLSVQITGLRPDRKLVDLLTLAHGADGRLLARGRALVSARDVAGAWD